MSGFETVRIAPEILAKLEAEGSEPVHAIGVMRHDDGTLDLTFRTVDLHAENERLREALRVIRGPEDSGPWIEIYRAAGGGYEGLQAIAEVALDG